MAQCVKPILASSLLSDPQVMVAGDKVPVFNFVKLRFAGMTQLICIGATRVKRTAWRWIDR